MTDAPEQSPPSEPPLMPPERPTWIPFAIAAGVIVVIALVALALRGTGGGAPDEAAYTVEAFTPANPLMTASERVIGHEAPDAESPAAVMFGEGVALNVTGRVARGLGADWFAVAWNERTVFVRAQDVVTGDGAPPTPIVREDEPEAIEEERPDEDLDKPEEDDVFAEVPSARLGTLEIGDVDWIREPGARDFARFYPEDALENGQSGRVVLDCVIGGGGRLDCSVAQESPGGEGFGRAAMNIARQVRVQPSLPDGSSAAGRHLRLPLNFRAG